MDNQRSVVFGGVLYISTTCSFDAEALTRAVYAPSISVSLAPLKLSEVSDEGKRGQPLAACDTRR